MTVHLGAVSFAGAGDLSANVREKVQRITATFIGAGSLSTNLREKVQRINVNFAGAGVISASFVQQQIIQTIFPGIGTLSADHSIVVMSVDFEVTSYLRAIISNPLTQLVGDPKARLVLAVEIDTIMIT
jgi:hypothetical protein